MNYIYDVYLNLNDTLYDFFDWNKNDKLMHIKKIPIIMVSNDVIKELINYKIKVDLEFLNNIYDKTELWNLSEKIDFCSLFSDNTTIIAIQFDNKGNSIEKSYLMIDEELEILDETKKFKVKELNYQVINKTCPIFKTRKEVREENFIETELKNIENDKLNYIYFECFGKHEKNKKAMLNSINRLSKNSKTYKNLYDILKLTSTTKNNL